MRTRWMRPLLAALIGLLTVALPTDQPSLAIDASWGFALHRWVTDPHLPTTYFTYGPLGFLTVPVAWQQATFAIALAFVVGLNVVFCWLLLARLSRLCPLLPAALVTWVLASLTLPAPAEQLMEVGVLAAAELLQRRPPHPPAWAAAFAVLSGPVLLVKFSTGLVWLGASAVVTVALVSSAWWRRGLGALAGAGCALLVAWCCFAGVTGRGADFGRWLRGSWEMASGYHAMGFEPVEASVSSYVAPAMVVAGLVAVCVALALRHRERTSVACALLVVGCGYVLFREGFTRHDLGHEGLFYSGLLTLPLALVLGARSRWLLLPLLLMVVDLGALQAHVLSPRAQLDSAGRLSVLRTDLDDVRSIGGVQERARAQMRAERPLAPSFLAALEGHRVQVDPYSTAILWSYGLRWGPDAVWALYSSYTPWLDDQSARSIEGGGGPDRILRALPSPALDSRFPAWESPRYQVVEACRWRTVAQTGRWQPGSRAHNWQVLAPTANRCGAPVELSRVSFRPGSVMVVPRPRHPGSVVTVRFELPSPLSERLATLLLKPARSFVRINEIGHPYPFITATAAQPHLLTAPGGLCTGFDVQRIVMDRAGTAIFEELPAVP